MNKLTNMFWDEHFADKNRAELSKIKQKVYDWLNEDNFGGFEVEYSGLKKPAQRQGYLTISVFI